MLVIVSDFNLMKGLKRISSEGHAFRDQNILDTDKLAQMPVK